MLVAVNNNSKESVKTIEWLELDEMEHAASSYFPSEFVENAEPRDRNAALDSLRKNNAIFLFQILSMLMKMAGREKIFACHFSLL